MNAIALKVETLTVHDANGQPYRLADAIFDVEGVKRLVVELAALKTNLAEISSKLVVAESESAALRAALKDTLEILENTPYVNEEIVAECMRGEHTLECHIGGDEGTISALVAIARVALKQEAKL